MIDVAGFGLETAVPIFAAVSQSSAAAGARGYNEGPSVYLLCCSPGPSITCGESISYKDRRQNLDTGEIYILAKRKASHTVIEP